MIACLYVIHFLMTTSKTIVLEWKILQDMKVALTDKTKTKIRTWIIIAALFQKGYFYVFLINSFLVCIPIVLKETYLAKITFFSQ